MTDDEAKQPDHAGVAFHPPLLLLASLAVGFLLGWLAPLPAGGPYRLSRNPIYLSMILLQVGVGIWTASLWFFILAAVCVALLTWGVILREERYLTRKFGDEYLSYKSRVRRWI
jgi:protein-S-isoprenylcysteine O-methyltransferase Ste14